MRLTVKMILAFSTLSLFALAVHSQEAVPTPSSVPAPKPAAASGNQPYWLEKMTAINVSSNAAPGQIAQLGDSITHTKAFWNPLGYSYPEKYLKVDPKDKSKAVDGMPLLPKGGRWRDWLKGVDLKGGENGNESGWTSGQVLSVVKKILERDTPEAAIIMVGTNDIAAGKVPEGYKANVEKIVDLCLEAKCIPILNTIPPRKDRDEAVKAANEIVRQIAQDKQVPLVDYYEEILKRQPDGKWYKTLISDDGVHPSNTGGKGNDFSEENMMINGYALRTWVNWLMVRELYFRVMSTPKPYTEKIGNIESIIDGQRCPVTADTEVSIYVGGGDNEQIWNWGAAKRLKAKSIEEFFLAKYDMSAAAGKKIKRAVLYLPRTDQCILTRLGISTISTDWAEGTGTGWTEGDKPKNPADQGSQSKGGATYTHAVYPDKPWTPEKAKFNAVVFSRGGSNWGQTMTGWAKDGDQQYYYVELPKNVADGLLIAGDTYGIAVAEDMGDREVRPQYKRKPNPNHFIRSKESGVGSFIVIQCEDVADKTAPAAIANAKTEIGNEPGDIALTWIVPADDEGKGGAPLGYKVYMSEGQLDAGSLTDANLLPRCQTYRPTEVGKPQRMPLFGLKPATTYNFAVVSYDSAGNASKPAMFSGQTRPAVPVTLAKPESTTAAGQPISKGPVRIWAAPSQAKIDPVTGNLLLDKSEGDYRNGNAAWNGKDQKIVLSAGSNDFAGFQVVVEKSGSAAVSGLKVELSPLGGAVSSTSKVDDLVVQGLEKSAEDFFKTMEDIQKNDEKLATEVFDMLKKVNALKDKQKNDPQAFMKEMSDLKSSNKDEFDRLMRLISAGKKTSGGSSNANFNEVFWIWSIQMKDEDAKIDGWFPDPLIPMADPIAIPNANNAIPNQKVQAFYLDLYVPHKTAAGKYAAKVTVTVEGAGEISIPVEVQVFNFELPDVLTFKSEMNNYGYSKFNDKSRKEAIENIHRLAHKNRLNYNVVPYSHAGNWTCSECEAIKADGSGSGRRLSGLDDWASTLENLFTGSAFENNPRKSVPITGYYLPLYEQFPCELKDGFKFDQDGRGAVYEEDNFTKDYKDGWTACMKQMAEYIRDKGWNKTSFHLFLNNKHMNSTSTYWYLDEPFYRIDFEALAMFGKLVRNATSGIKGPIIQYRVDLSRPEEDRRDVDRADLMVVAQNAYLNWPTISRSLAWEYIPKADQPNQELWFYGGTNPLATSNVANRAFTIKSWLNGADGVLPWLTNGKDESWTDGKAAENAVFYPAYTKWKYNGMYPSLRLKAFRDGQQDAEYLNLLLAKLGTTRRQVSEAMKTLGDFYGKVIVKNDLDAGTVVFDTITPDVLHMMRQVIGYNIDQAATKK